VKLPPPPDILWLSGPLVVNLRAFAEWVGYSHRSIQNDLTSSDPARRAQWPEFRRTAGRRWVTTPDAIRAWWDRLDSSHLAAPVAAALGRKRA